MALARRVATSLPQQKVSPEAAPAEQAQPVTVGRLTRRQLMDHVPTQRGTIPEPPAPAPAPAPQQPERRRSRTALVAVSLTVTAALVGGSAVVVHQRSVRVAERSAADVRVAAALDAQLAGTGTVDAVQRSGEGAWTAALTSAHQAAQAAADSGTAQLAAAPHAAPALLAGLRSAVDLASGTAADPTASLTALTVAAAGVAGPAKAAQDAEAAWQVAEQARIAAEQKAAADAAAAKAAADAAAKAAATPKSAKKTTTKPSGSSGTQGSSSPSGGAQQAIPAGGLVCPGAPVGAAAGESSVQAIGAAINAYRQSNGLPALAIVRSGTLVAHAEDMAASGGIWHSGQDNIVGCTSGSVQSLLNAWSHSAAHNAQMLRTDVSTMKVGGATAGGWLYGAVKFSS